MKTQTFKTAKQFKKMFNFNLQPNQIKSVNGIAVNVFNGSLCMNELTVSQMHVNISSYFPEKQDTTTASFNAPFIVEY